MLNHDLPFILMVVCPNLNGTHEHVYVQYVLWGKGKLTIEPTYKFIMGLRKYLPDEPLEFVIVTCRHCRAKGIKGMSHFTPTELTDITFRQSDDKDGEDGS